MIASTYREGHSNEIFFCENNLHKVFPHSFPLDYPSLHSLEWCKRLIVLNLNIFELFLSLAYHTRMWASEKGQISIWQWMCVSEKIFLIKLQRRKATEKNVYMHLYFLCENIFVLVVHNECLAKAISNKQFVQPFSVGMH